MRIQLSKSSINKDLLPYCILFLLSIIAAWFAINPFKYGFLSDWTSYVSIAKKYSDGNVKDAINGYWSPFISWILGVFFLFNMDITNAGILLFILSVAINLVSIYFLLNQLDFTNRDKLLLFAASILGTLYFASVYKTPDLLSCSIHLIYIGLIIIFSKNPSVVNGIKIGIAGGVSYYIKYFNFPFFIVHFTLIVFILCLFKKKPSIIIKSSIACFATFVLISLPWIFLLSKKYNQITFSTSGIYNTSILSPEWRVIDGNLEQKVGLLPPPNSQAFSAWEDPTYYPIQKWSPWQSLSNFQYNLKNVTQNLYILKYSIRYCSILAFPILLLSILLIFRNAYLEKKIFFIIIVSCLFVYSIGYVFIAIEERYFIVFYFLLIIAGIKFISQIHTINNYLSYFLLILKAAIILSFIAMPIRNYHVYLINNSVGEDLYNLTQNFGKALPKHARFVSNEYEIPIFFAMYSDKRFYGTPRPEYDIKETEKELKRNDIHYYLYIGKEPPLFLHDKIKVLEDESTYIKVYKLDNI